MKKFIFMFSAILSALAVTACGLLSSHINDIYQSSDTLPSSQNQNRDLSAATVTVIYRTFEETLLTGTDIVSVRYVTHRPFGENLIEFEFQVIDRILGNAADIIFVYAANEDVMVLGSGNISSYNQGALRFNTETNYLLVLRKLEGATLRTHEDGFLFINNIVINLDNPGMSMMYNEPLHLHTSSAYLNVSDTDSLISFISDLTADNRPAREHIRSTNMSDIIAGSPYVLIIEINEPRRLVAEQTTRDWMETDIYFVTVVGVLKGNLTVGYEISVVFFADTVRTGEQHIVAVERLTERSTTFVFTSRNSLFSYQLLTEITEIVVER